MINAVQYLTLDAFYQAAERMFRQGQLFYGNTITLTIIYFSGDY